MPAIYNDSEAIHQLRKTLNDTIAELKKQHRGCGKLIEEASYFWKDEEFMIFSNDYNQATETFKLLFKKMEDYDKKVLSLEMALRNYEESKPSIRRI